MKSNWNFGMMAPALVLWLLTSLAIAQPPALDSLMRELEGSSQNERVDILLSIVESRNNSRFELEKAHAELEEALLLAETNAYLEGQAKAYALKGTLFMKTYQADSAVIAYQKAKELYLELKDEAKANNLTISQGESLFVIGKYHQSDSLAEMVSRSETYEADALLQERVLMLRASNAWGKGQYSQAIPYYEELIVRLESTESFKMLDKAYSGMATSYAGMNEYAMALKYLLSSLDILEKLGANARQMGLRYLNIGTMYADMEDYERSLEYADLARKNLEEVNFSNGLVYVYHLFGQAHQGLAENGKAFDWYNKSLELVLEVQPTNVYMLEGLYRNLGSLCFDLEKFKTGVSLAQRGLNLAKEGNNLHSVAKSHLVLAENFYGLKNKDKALQHLRSCEAIAAEQGYKDVLLALYERMAEVYAKSNESTLALNYFKKHLAIRDSLEEIEQRGQVAELQTKYETEKKENEIKQLSQQTEIQELQLKQRQFWIYGISVFSVLLAVSGLLYYRQRKLINRQQATEMEQKLLRSQMNPHFIFNALGSIRNALFEKTRDETELYLTKFGKLMRQILEHSRADFIPLQDEIDMLRNYCDLQQFRFNQSFEYQIHLNDQIDPEELSIPPMLAQPFIENALEHGLRHDQRDGKIDIEFTLQEEELFLTITDNGRGIEETQRLKTTHSGHQSLASIITRERLINFGEQMKLTIEQLYKRDQQVAGTKVSLALPFKEI